MGYVIARWQAWEEIDGKVHKSLYWDGDAWTPTWSDAEEYPWKTAKRLRDGFNEEGIPCCAQPVHPPRKRQLQ